MISTFLSFIGLGLSLAIPVGTITIEMVKQGVRRGFWHSFSVAMGGLTADIVFMTLVYAGVAQFLLLPTGKLILWLLGLITLCYLGYESIKEGLHPVAISAGKDRALFQCFFTGFTMAIVNPINIIFWLGIYGSVLATIIDKVDFSKTLLYSSAIFLGVVLWDVFVSSTVHFTRKLFSPSLIQLFSIIAGISLIGFGVYFGYQATTLLS